MDIELFLQQRKPAWDRLQNLLAQAERSPLWELGPNRLRELVTLYRQACSDLNRARAMTANPEVLDRLNQLTGQAYRFIYQEARDCGFWGSFWGFLWNAAPLAFQRQRSAVAWAAGSLLLGAVVGFVAVLVDPGCAEDLVPTTFFTARPSERVDRIERGSERIDDAEKAIFFSANLYIHNIQVSFLAFGLGALTLVGVPIVLFYNGAILGGLAALYYIDGVTVFFLSWVGPHGALELPAIVLAGAAGLYAGRAIWLHGDLSRSEAIHRAVPVLWNMLSLVMLMLVIAGLIEGSFSQFSTKAVPYAVKIGVAFLLFAGLLVYLGHPREAYSAEGQP